MGPPFSWVTAAARSGVNQVGELRPSLSKGLRKAHTAHIRKSSRNSDAGLTPVTSRWSRARVQAT